MDCLRRTSSFSSASGGAVQHEYTKQKTEEFGMEHILLSILFGPFRKMDISLFYTGVGRYGFPGNGGIPDYQACGGQCHNRESRDEAFSFMDGNLSDLHPD
jgi:hypothetical protein